MSENKQTEEKSQQAETPKEQAEKPKIPASARKPGQNYSSPKFTKQ